MGDANCGQHPGSWQKNPLFALNAEDLTTPASCVISMSGAYGYLREERFPFFMEDGMEDVDVWHSIRFFLMVVLGLTALGVAFFAVA